MVDRWRLAVQKLTDLTRSGDLKWKASHEFCRHRQRDLDCVGPAFLAKVNDKDIALYEFRYKDQNEPNDMSWNTGIAIEFIDPNYEPEWVWPGVDEHYALLDEVRKQTSHANEFLASFLQNSA